jgi:hypothetical protein
MKRSETVLLGAAGLLVVIAGYELYARENCHSSLTGAHQAECSSSGSRGSSSGHSSFFGGGSGTDNGSSSTTARGGFGSYGHFFSGGG